MKNITLLLVVICVTVITYSFIHKTDDEPLQTVTVPIKGRLEEKSGATVHDKYKVYIFENQTPKFGERSKRHTHTKVKTNPGTFEFQVTGQVAGDPTALASREIGYEENVSLNFYLVFERYTDNLKKPTKKDTLYYYPPVPYQNTASVYVDKDGGVKQPIELKFSLPDSFVCY